MSPSVPSRRKGDARLGRDLKLFHVYRFLVTSYLFIPVLVMFFQARGLDFTEIALLNTVYALTAIAFEVPTGALADRFGRCRAMLLGALLMAIGCVVDYHGHGFWTFALGEGLLALGMTLTSGADSAYLYDLLRSAGREHEYRRHEGSATAAKLVGAAAALVAGGLLARESLAITYAVTAGVCGAAALVAFMMREPAFEREDESDFLHGMAHAARATLKHPSLRFAVGFSVLVFTLLRMGLYLYPTYLDAAGLGVGWIGGVLALMSVAGAIGASRIEWIRRLCGESKLVWGLPLALAASYGLLGRWFAIGGIALLGVQAVANGIYSPFSKELLNREIADSGQRATVLSVESMARRLAFGAFAPLAGFVIDRHGLSSGFYLCAALGLFGGALLVASSVRRRRRGLGGFSGELVTPLPLDTEGGAAQIQPSISAGAAGRR
ncbi:MAG TPA: MFS transporter [Polyangia bacterium]|jgi:predicted MFS family arabinose efflux permease